MRACQKGTCWNVRLWLTRDSFRSHGPGLGFQRSATVRGINGLGNVKWKTFDCDDIEAVLGNEEDRSQ
jgi:hypothetical protein